VFHAVRYVIQQIYIYTARQKFVCKSLHSRVLETVLVDTEHLKEVTRVILQILLRAVVLKLYCSSHHTGFENVFWKPSRISLK